MNFSEEHIQQIKSKALSVDDVQQQIATFKQGIPFVKIVEAATIGNGIIQLTAEQQSYYSNLYSTKNTNLSVLKFVPASGAATRMFKFLHTFLNQFNPKKESLNAYINNNKAEALSLCIVGLEKLPFYDLVLQHLRQNNIDYEQLTRTDKFLHFVNAILNTNQLNYGGSPKGLIPFHKYKNRVVTAFEEHLYEAVLYATVQQIATLHFTISKQFKDKFIQLFNAIKTRIEQQTQVNFDISYSFQNPNTDTIAVNPNNTPYITSENQLLFRPAGHGALIKNLNNLKADIIFIKNIDNVVVEQFRDVVATHKKILAGVLLEVQSQSFRYLKQLENADISEDDLTTIAEFLTRQLNIKISNEFEKYSQKYKIEYLFEKLNRPIRVCGMVLNEGEPGGGPFWVVNQNHQISLQIVESAQIDFQNEQQRNSLQNATHFNPVDVVCGTKNYKGVYFNLEDFVDHKSGFITHKTVNGNPIKALELPGLWNGGMAHWNTIFVEVPVITFNPVKTVNDLLKSPHQIT